MKPLRVMSTGTTKVICGFYFSQSLIETNINMLMLGIIYSKVLLQASLKNKNSFLLKKKMLKNLIFFPKRNAVFALLVH